eukprot:CAMPEP_0183432366 /NCGR_PEP_ID=MMETSP0370-20130417/57126_1 /TAXON_ID=268820 /ORGANISM="Peridinium aciculiferum, Strain PAER-2" /LENGTH=44 /DNA_ID= /DNA_START= /DNA_END= /DNA_ORIENTATION=
MAFLPAYLPWRSTTTRPALMNLPMAAVDRRGAAGASCVGGGGLE